MGRNQASRGRGGRGRGKRDRESEEGSYAKGQGAKAIDLEFRIGDESHASNYFKLTEAIGTYVRKTYSGAADIAHVVEKHEEFNLDAIKPKLAKPTITIAEATANVEVKAE